MAFFSWSARRQLIILGLIVAVLTVPFSYVLFSILYTPPSCFDGTKNQDELGVDCGGSCRAVCKEHVTPLTVLWSRAIEVLPGVYDAVALAENPNPQAGILEIPYRFTLYDSSNIPIAQREGATYVNPNEQFAVYEPAIRMGERIPARTLFEFTEEPAWITVTAEKPGLFVKDRVLEDEGINPKLRGTLVNPSLANLEDVVITALLLDRNDNAVAVGKTEVDFLPKNSSKDITFVWPRQFKQAPDVCVVPLDIMLAFDRSGSMNDDGDSPPQPLSDAEEAAISFVQTLSAQDKIGLVSFATSASDPIDQQLSTDHARTRNALLNISIPPEEEVGFTNLGEGILRARQELRSVRTRPEAQKAMVILTDGLANYPEDPGGEVYAGELALRAKSNDIVLYVIGLGEKVNAPFLSGEIATSPEEYYPAAESRDLLRVYREIGRVVCPERVYPIKIMPRVNLVQ